MQNATGATATPGVTGTGAAGGSQASATGSEHNSAT